MGDPPQNYLVEQVVDDNKVVIEGTGQVEVLPVKGESLPSLSTGQQLHGWLNIGGKYGPYIRLAAPRRDNGDQQQAPQQASPLRNDPSPTPVQTGSLSRTDATGRSIERQVAAKIAGELIGHDGYTAMDEATFAQAFFTLTNAIASAIRGEDSDVPF